MSKIGQSPPPLIQEALLSTIKALSSDNLMRHSDADVLVTVTACLHDIMRISAPTAPYDDEKMKVRGPFTFHLSFKSYFKFCFIT